MTQVMTLVGIARAIPDVATFVTPVFVDALGNYLIQDADGDRVTGFRPVLIGEEFQALPRGLEARVGNAALFGFELSATTFLIGSASSLGSILDAVVEHHPMAADDVSKTKAAVVRFIAETSTGTSTSGVPSSQLVAFIKHSGDIEFSLRRVRGPRDLEEATERDAGQAVEGVCLMIIAHAPLASALKAVATHTFPECSRLHALDVWPDTPVREIEARAQDLLLGSTEALIFTDAFGATPCNIAQRLASGVEGAQIKVLAGVNVPMLWRSIMYTDDPLELLMARAMAGGTQGIMQVAISRPQQQARLARASVSAPVGPTRADPGDLGTARPEGF